MVVTEESSLKLKTPPVVTDLEEIRRAVLSAQKSGQSVGVVPTMGSLHAGHLSLVEASVGECEFTVVTIFVNPTQFQPGEDFARYPRDLESDLRKLELLPVNAVFAPSGDDMYPAGFSTFIDPPAVAQPLEGQHRHDHFRGVATVVLKLFNLIPANVAYFGQKDYQQSLVIRRMVEDLDLPVTIRVCPTVREPDGVACSSRNLYLTATQREQARALSRCLAVAAEAVKRGQREASKINERMRNELNGAGIQRIDYAALVDPETLIDVLVVEQQTLAAVAAYVGSTRLIDNRLIG